MNAADLALASGMGRGCWSPLLQLAAQEVFDLMLGSALTKPVDTGPQDSLDISAMVGLAGRLCGVVTIRCSSKSAVMMAARMLGTEPDQAGSEMWDAVGEICNMVAGNFKNKISGLSDGCMLSVPTVITGGDYSVHSLADEGALQIAMAFEGAPVIFSLEVHS
ncbi:MAG TPA: chemotaxis protein CheX [Terriglobales bacterium]|nr:chemotaxis protein CheX [Terriglobales bacterium]